MRPPPILRGRPPSRRFPDVTTLRGTRPVAAVIVLMALSMAVLAKPSAAEPSLGWKAFADKDFETADRIWREDAARGNPHGAFGLALLADRAGDEQAAASWYEKAAMGGLPSAQVLIGQRYAEGHGIEQSAIKAYAWYSRAAASGVPNAEKLRDRLGAAMSPDQIKEAEALAETLVSP